MARRKGNKKLMETIRVTEVIGATRAMSTKNPRREEKARAQINLKEKTPDHQRKKNLKIKVAINLFSPHFSFSQLCSSLTPVGEQPAELAPRVNSRNLHDRISVLVEEDEAEKVVEMLENLSQKPSSTTIGPRNAKIERKPTEGKISVSRDGLASLSFSLSLFLSPARVKLFSF